VYAKTTVPGFSPRARVLIPLGYFNPIYENIAKCKVMRMRVTKKRKYFAYFRANYLSAKRVFQFPQHHAKFRSVFTLD
jgi:hypothetical protein